MSSSGVALEPHPWNAEFVWEDHEPPFRTVTPEQARQFDEAGYFVPQSMVGYSTQRQDMAARASAQAAGRASGRS